MTNNSSVCADASLLIKLAVPEDLSDRAWQKWSDWNESGVSVMAPRLVLYEFVSAAWQKVRRSLMTLPEAEDALETMFDLPLQFAEATDQTSTLATANALGLANSYDAHYLALAQELGCEFWTADERLFNSVRSRYPSIRWLGTV